MTLLKETAGCKVGWATYDDETEAQARSVEAKKDADRKWRLGYDFGYCVPGEIQHVAEHPDHGEVWIVTLP